MYPPGAVVLTQPVAADRASIWRAIAEPEGMARWQADVAEGSALLGGRLRLGWPALGAALEVEVVERIELERIVLRAGEALVRLQIGSGEVMLSHEGLAPDPELCEGTRSGWRLSLALLAHALEVHPGRPRSVAWAMSTAETTAAQAHAFFTDAAALGSWLGQGTGVSTPGSCVELRLASGQTLRGTVLANADGRDVALSWSEQGDSVLVLRTLPLGPSGRLIAACWSRWGAVDPAASTVADLSTAVQRLARVLSGRAES